MTIGILGGGLTGVTLQHFLTKDSELLEASDRRGGLCKSYQKEGFLYDIGGHILFSKNEEINTVVGSLLAGNIHTCKRLNKILFNDRLIKYPFENDLGSLKKKDAYECLIGYLQNDYPKPEHNLKEWAYYTFGKHISEKYLLPYNEKIWNISTEQLNLEWVERIPRPPLEDVVKSALGIETEGYLHQLYFRYPVKGGAEALITSLQKPDQKILCNYKIDKIRKSKSGWNVYADDHCKSYEEIIITFPIHEAITCFENVPDNVSRAAERLRYNSITVIMVAINNESLLDCSAIYIPDPKVLPHRVCFMGYFSRQNVREGTSSLIAEITTNPGDGIHELSAETLVEKTIEDLARIHVIDTPAEVIVTETKRFQYAYPVYTLNYARDCKIVRDYFNSLNIQLCGRFAEFEYINMDECMRRAIVLANKLNRLNG